MNTPEDCRQRAAECERLAAEAKSQDNRATLLTIAMRWRAMAEHDARATVMRSASDDSSNLLHKR